MCECQGCGQPLAHAPNIGFYCATSDCTYVDEGAWEVSFAADNEDVLIEALNKIKNVKTLDNAQAIAHTTLMELL